MRGGRISVRLIAVVLATCSMFLLHCDPLFYLSMSTGVYTSYNATLTSAENGFAYTAIVTLEPAYKNIEPLHGSR